MGICICQEDALWLLYMKMSAFTAHQGKVDAEAAESGEEWNPCLWNCEEEKNFFIASFAIVSQTTKFQLWCTAGFKVEKALN